MTGDAPTVLLVDDEVDVVEVYAMALDDDYAVRKAYSGEEALDRVDEHVDVVLLDRRMPGLSGQEVLEEIRDRGLEVRVAMVTAVDPDFDILEMGFDAYLTKPVGDDDLRGVIEELLTLSRYDDDAKELFAIAEKRAALQEEKTRWELEESEAYQSLERRREQLEAQSAEAFEDMDEQLFQRMLSGI